MTSACAGSRVITSRLMRAPATPTVSMTVIPLVQNCPMSCAAEWRSMEPSSSPKLTTVAKATADPLCGAKRKKARTSPSREVSVSPSC